MATKKTIAIIKASGHMGSAIVKILAKKNHRLLLFSEESQELDELLADLRENTPDLEFEFLGCPKEASWEADIIILTVSQEQETEYAEKIKSFATGKAIISMSNLFQKTAVKGGRPVKPQPVIDLKELLPHSRIIRAFEGPIMDGEILEKIIDQQ